jgi:hypothetical protein
MIVEMKISIASLQASVNSLNDEVAKMKQTTTTITEIHIHIYPCKSEPISELPALSEVRKLFRKPAESIAGVLQLKLNNPKTHNIRITNARSNLVQTYNYDWINCIKKRGLLDCANFHLELLKGHYGAETNPIWNAWYEGSGLDYLEDEEDKLKNPAWRFQMEKVENVVLSYKK